jgi:hypothetical protein
MKQTAVEWLEEKLSKSSSDELVGNINKWFQQAKEMEKQQIMEAYNNGEDRSAELYYNENYKEDKQ